MKRMSHRVLRGETSTYIANGGKQTFPYEGKHRPDVKPGETKIDVWTLLDRDRFKIKMMGM